MLATFAAVACVEENLEPNHHPVAEGEAIEFCVGKPETRTIYESTDSKQILWNNGDEIRVFYAFGAGDADLSVISSDYVVTRLTSDGSDADATIGDEGTIAAKTADNQLTWQEAETHKFYATWPANNNITVSKNGIATFPINRDQKCYIQTDEEKSADSDATKYTYVARPDMANAYMVATSESAPESSKIWLTFKPIMTTLNIVVKGPQNLTSEGKPDDNTTASPIVVTGVSIISTIQTNTTASKAVFNYDINNGKITGSASGSGNMTEQTETTFISIVNTDGLNAITLNQGETLCLTAFLPPMAEETAEALQRDIKIRVHTTGGNKTMTLAEASALTPSAKGSIKLPSVYTPISGSNWITPLDDDIYVSQLSIPGTHDAATYDGTIFNAGRTQGYSIQQQWDMGVRAFDLRPAWQETYSLLLWDWGWQGDGEMWIWHGLTATSESFIGTLDTLRENLLKPESENELAIVIFKHESEWGLDLSEGKMKRNDESYWQNAMATLLNDYEEKYNAKDGSDIFATFTPNMTVGDCRGKILLLCRDWTPYTTTGKPTHGAYMGWGHSRTGTKNETIYGKDDNSSTIFFVQDCYAASEASLSDGESYTEVKWTVISDFIDEAIQFKDHIKYPSSNGMPWMINHTSGYTGRSGTESLYQENAEYQNIRFYEKITQLTEPGPLGIIMSDWVGTRSAGGYQVYGDLLPQAIIDNNYKFRLRRAGEE